MSRCRNQLTTASPVNSERNFIVELVGISRLRLCRRRLDVIEFLLDRRLRFGGDSRLAVAGRLRLDRSRRLAPVLGRRDPPTWCSKSANSSRRQASISCRSCSFVDTVAIMQRMAVVTTAARSKARWVLTTLAFAELFQLQQKKPHPRGPTPTSRLAADIGGESSCTNNCDR